MLWMCFYMHLTPSCILALDIAAPCTDPQTVKASIPHHVPACCSIDPAALEGYEKFNHS